MRSIQILGLTCLAAMSCAASAADAAGPMPHPLAITLARADVSDSALQYSVDDRLRYLGGSGCQEARGCSRVSAPGADAPHRYQYVDALDIGTYGPMRLKFTGDRVKLRVSF